MEIKKRKDQENVYDISIVKCDSGYISITPRKRGGAPIELGENDTIRIQVRDKPSDELLFDGDVYRDEDGSFTWHIHPDDTHEAKIKTYYWDAQIEYADPEDTFTFINLSEFRVMDEVTKRT